MLINLSTLKVNDQNKTGLRHLAQRFVIFSHGKRTHNKQLSRISAEFWETCRRTTFRDTFSKTNRGKTTRIPDLIDYSKRIRSGRLFSYDFN